MAGSEWGGGGWQGPERTSLEEAWGSTVQYGGLSYSRVYSRVMVGRIVMVSDLCYWWKSVGGGEDNAKRSVRCNNQISGVNFHVPSGGVRWLQNLEHISSK